MKSIKREVYPERVYAERRRGEGSLSTRAWKKNRDKSEEIIDNLRHKTRSLRLA